MRDRAEAAGVVHMAFFTFRWVPLYLRLKQLLEEGFIGRCLSCDFHNLAGIANDTQYIWQMDPQRSNGVLGDRGVHTIDLGALAGRRYHQRQRPAGDIPGLESAGRRQTGCQ